MTCLHGFSFNDTAYPRLLTLHDALPHIHVRQASLYAQGLHRSVVDTGLQARVTGKQLPHGAVGNASLCRQPAVVPGDAGS